MFRILPVVDLMGGLVVRARAGERERYAPLSHSRLCRSPDPLEVVAAFQALHPFSDIYVADLDAIRGGAPQSAVVAALERAFPQLRFWIDAGFADDRRIDAFLASCRGLCVLGSESQTHATLVARWRHEPRIVLSLDWRGDQPLGPAELFQCPALWPSRIIVMTLARVGTGRGPDFGALQAVREAAGDAEVYAAGGVRDAADLRALARLGCAGVLVASALHDGRIGSRELAEFA